MDELLEKTALVDFDHPSIRDLVASRGWVALDEEAKIRERLRLVRDEMRFGTQGRCDPGPPGPGDGYGKCNTKGILLMALLVRSVSSRFHGFTIDKRLQKGARSGICTCSPHGRSCIAG
jgi:hypothetical protein